MSTEDNYTPPRSTRQRLAGLSLTAYIVEWDAAWTRLETLMTIAAEAMPTDPETRDVVYGRLIEAGMSHLDWLAANRPTAEDETPAPASR